MYAIITTGGKQYKAVPGEVLEVEKLKAEVGKQVEFDQVLLLVDGDEIKIGAPYLSGIKVVGKITKQGRGEKISIIKFRRRKHYMRKQGHRQSITAVKFEEIKK